MKCSKIVEKIKQQLDWTFIPKILTPALLITLISISLNVGRAVQRIESLTFDSADQKAKILQVADTHLSEVEIYKGFARIRELEDRQAAIKNDIEEIKKSLIKIEKQTK